MPKAILSRNSKTKEKACKLISSLIESMEKVIRGKHEVIELLLTCLISGGHVLIEDVPGLGKTTIAKTLAKLISKNKKGESVSFKRIQFTPDLLPYDITGVDIFDPEKKKFVFAKGPVFANIVLADEINRTTPKVQSALLEVMAEKQVTVGNRTYSMEPLFFVIATQNPIETAGTYPLPFAQIDRFIMKLKVGYPDENQEIDIVKENPSIKIMPNIKPVCGKEDILEIQNIADNIYCDEKLIKTAVSVVNMTRKHQGIELGASPRASIMLIKAAKAYALVKGREYVIDQDIIDLAPLIIAHRLKLKDINLDIEYEIRSYTINQLAELKY
jgi:MoxR-like ATPase